MRILYVEDERFLAEAVKHNLEKRDMDVDLASDGEEGLNMALNGVYDCIVLDIMLPKLSGTDILQRLREKKISTPIIMLSALADDYLAKPFKTAELTARIMALMRRPAKVQEQILEFLDLKYNMDEKELNGVRLTTKEAGIINELMKTPEKIVKKEYLLNKVWGAEAYGEDNYIEVYMSRLRKVLKNLKSKAKITTVRGLGYKIVKA